MAAAMDAKQLQDAGKQIAKAVDGGDPSSTLMVLLTPLQKFTATEDLLRQSKIGVAVNKLRQNKDPKVAELATRLINKWKQDVRSSERKKAGSSPSPAAKGQINGVANGRSATGSPAPASKTEGLKVEAGAKRRSKASPEKRNSKEDEVNTTLTGDAARDACLRLMYDGLAFMSEESPDDILPVAQTIEVAAFSEFRQETSTQYKQRMRSLYMNLKMKENKELRRAVFNGTIDPSKFVTMTSEELKSAEKKAEDKKLKDENMNKAMTAQEELAISTTLTCGKCKQSRVGYTLAQTRSADEPMTTFCRCTNCGHQWKFS